MFHYAVLICIIVCTDKNKQVFKGGVWFVDGAERRAYVASSASYAALLHVEHKHSGNRTCGNNLHVYKRAQTSINHAAHTLTARRTTRARTDGDEKAEQRHAFCHRGIEALGADRGRKQDEGSFLQ